jgi:hypothetical protein
MAANYDAIRAGSQQNLHSSPYGSGDPYYNESTGYITPMQSKKRLSPWIKFGVPVAVLVVIGVVVGIVVGTHHSSSSSSSSASSSGGKAGAAASSAASAKNAIGIFPTATNSFYEMPLYPSTVGSQRQYYCM